nr:MAG TPA: hypothetical protein [Caudoviricetes sp.]
MTSTFPPDSCLVLVYDCLIVFHHLLGHKQVFGTGDDAGVFRDEFQTGKGYRFAQGFQFAVFHAAYLGFRPAHCFTNGLLPTRRKGVQYRPLVLAGGFNLGGG